MTKYLFTIILFSHGLIHFIEFARVFGNDHVSKFSKELPGLEAFLWLITAAFFIFSTTLFLRREKTWPYIVISTAVVSQVLIFSVWNDTWLGTLINLVLILVALPALMQIRLTKQIDREAVILSRFNVHNKFITRAQLDPLPVIVRKWLTHSGVIGKDEIRFVRLKQKGKIRLKPNGKWMALDAEQFINAVTPSSLWKATVQLLPGVFLSGTDRFFAGKGEMHMKLFALIKVAEELPSPKMNSATMIRFLSEIMWHPTAALHEYIHWEDIGANMAKASFSLEQQTVSGIFTFSEEGDVTGFEAERYKETGVDAVSVKWEIKVSGYKDFSAYRIPCKAEVTWYLPTGKFTSASFEIESLEFNVRLHA